MSQARKRRSSPMARFTRCSRWRSSSNEVFFFSGFCGDTTNQSSCKSECSSKYSAIIMCPTCIGLNEPKYKPVFFIVLFKKGAKVQNFGLHHVLNSRYLNNPEDVFLCRDAKFCVSTPFAVCDVRRVVACKTRYFF